MNSDNQNKDAILPQEFQAVARQLMDQARQKRAQELLDGTVPPPNPYAGFILTQIKTVYEQAGQLDHQLGAARMQVRALEQQITKLMGAAEQYLRDLETWDKPAEDIPAVPMAPGTPQNGAHEPKAS